MEKFSLLRESQEACLFQQKWLETELLPEIRGSLWTPDAGVYPGMETSNVAAGPEITCCRVCGDEGDHFGHNNFLLTSPTLKVVFELMVNQKHNNGYFSQLKKIYILVLQ